MAYLNRVFDVRLKAHLKAMGAVLIEEPKWCGKTTTAKQLANSVISLQDTDHREEYLATAITKPSFLLEGEVPRLIDEWQDAVFCTTTLSCWCRFYYDAKEIGCFHV